MWQRWIWLIFRNIKPKMQVWNIFIENIGHFFLISYALQCGPAYLQLFCIDMNGISWQPLSFIQHYLIWSRAPWTLEAYMSFYHHRLSQPTVEHSSMIEIPAPGTGTHVSYRWQIHHEMSRSIVLSIWALHRLWRYIYHISFLAFSDHVILLVSFHMYAFP